MGCSAPRNGEVYLTLTEQRGRAASDYCRRCSESALSTTTERTTGRRPEGQSERTHRAPGGGRLRFADALSFTWDVFLFGARASADPVNVNLSGLRRRQRFLQPRRLWFSYANPGLLWIQTDDGAYTDVTNCMMLAAVPGEVGDGEARLVTNTDAAASSCSDDLRRQGAGRQELRRFLVGPKECEITGIAETPDGKTLFVNIQHPGEIDPAEFRHRCVWQSLAGRRHEPAAIGNHRDHEKRRRRGRYRLMR